MILTHESLKIHSFSSFMAHSLHTRLGISYSVYNDKGENKTQGYFLRIGETEFYLPNIEDLSKKSVRKMMRKLRERFFVIDDLMEKEGIRPRTIKRLLEGAVEEEERRIRESQET